MKTFKLSSKQQIIAVAAVAVVLAVIFIVVLLVPQVIKLGDLGAQEQTALNELNAAKATYGQLEELKKTSRKTENELIRVDRKAPEEAELPALLIQIEDISAKAGIGFMSIKPSEPIQKDDYMEVPLEIQINGYFFSLLDFVYRLEKLPRVINVTGIDIKAGKLGLPNIETTLKCSAFVTTPGVKSKSGSTTVAPAGATSATGAATGAAATGATAGGTAQ